MLRGWVEKTEFVTEPWVTYLKDQPSIHIGLIVTLEEIRHCIDVLFFCWVILVPQEEQVTD